MKKKLPLGGEIQSLLPLLDLAVPGLGTSLSAVVGMIPGKQQTKKLETPTNPFRTFQNGGNIQLRTQKKNNSQNKVKLGDIEFYEDDVRPTKKLYSIVKDLKTGKDYGVIKNDDGSWRYKNSGLEDMYISKLQKDYQDYGRKSQGSDENTIINNGDSIEITKGKDRGAKVPTAILDSAIVAAKRQNVDPSLILGLISRESGFGSTESYDKFNKRSSDNKTQLISAWNLGTSTTPITPEMYLAGKGVPGVKVNKSKGGWNAVIEDSNKVEEYLKSNEGLMDGYSKEIVNFKPSKSTNAFDWGIQKLKTEGFQKYNPGDPRYPSMLKKDIDSMKADKNIQSYVKKRLPELAFGGKLKEYNLPTHEQGGGMVDKMGNPGMNPVAEIEKKEVVYTDKRGTNPYVFSDTLKDSDGKTFAMKAKEYQKFDKKDQVNQATYKKLMNELQIKNDLAREAEKQVATPAQMPNGGLIDDASMDATINYDMRKRAYKNVLGNLQSGAFPMLPPMDTIPSGSDNILYNAKINPLVSQTASKVPDITQPQSTTQTTPNVLGSLDLGKVGGILKGVALAGSAVDAFQKPEQEQLRVPDFSKGDKAYTGLGGSFDPIRNDIVQQAKSGENQIMQSAGNFGQVMSRLNSLQAGVGRNLAQVGLQEKQYNDQIRMSKGQREDQKATITANEQIRKQTADSQNKAMGQDLVANLIQNVNNYGTEFMKQDTMTKQLAALDKEKQRAFLTQLSLMNIKNPNFQINKDLINSDNPLSALKFVDNGSK